MDNKTPALHHVDSVTLTFSDCGDSCMVVVTVSPPIPEGAALDTNQPSLQMVYAILSAIGGDNITEEGTTKVFAGMRGIPE
jgi:hypothetical protein